MGDVRREGWAVVAKVWETTKGYEKALWMYADCRDGRSPHMVHKSFGEAAKLSVLT